MAKPATRIVDAIRAFQGARNGLWVALIKVQEMLKAKYPGDDTLVDDCVQQFLLEDVVSFKFKALPDAHDGFVWSYLRAKVRLAIRGRTRRDAGPVASYVTAATSAQAGLIREKSTWDPSSGLQLTELQQQVRAAVAQLPELQQTILKRWLKGKTIKEIASELGVQISRVYRARLEAYAQLRTQLRFLVDGTQSGDFMGPQEPIS